MYSSLFLSFVCVVSLYTWPWPSRWGETHTVPRPPTWGHTSPQSGHHGCGQWAPNVWTSQVPGTSGDPRKKSRVGFVFPQLSLRSQAPPVFTLVPYDFLLVWKLMLEVNIVPCFCQALSFLSRWGVEKTWESWAERRGAALFSSEETVDWKESTAAASPAARWLFARSLCPGTNSPDEPASLLNLNVLENWNDYQVAHLRGLQEPQGRWIWERKTRSLTAALIPRRATEPHSEKNTVTQRSPPQLQSPEIWALTLRQRHGVFQTEARPGLHPGLHVPGHTEQSGLNVLIKSAQSCLNSISVDRTWRGLNLPYRQNLVRFR